MDVEGFLNIAILLTVLDVFLTTLFLYLCTVHSYGSLTMGC